MEYSPSKIALTALLVVVSGWGAGYLMLKGLGYIYLTQGTHEVTDQQALSLEARIINPLVLQSEKSTAVVDDGQHLTIMIGGDIMFDRGIRAIGERRGYRTLFDDSVHDLFGRADLVIANLEGPLTDEASKTLVAGKTTESFMFTFAPAAIEALTSAGISIVSLANNHTDNFGLKGFLSTQRYLREAGISWFGNPWNSTSTTLTSRDAPDSALATIIERDGIRIALVGYHAFQSGVDRVVTEIRRVSQPGVFTIVMPHWGEEYITTPSDKMRSYARTFISAGADAVIAAHPHVVAEQEWVGGVPVYYSLGNLLFDQYFDKTVMHGLVVELQIENTDGDVSLTRVTDHRVAIKPGIGTYLER